MADTEKAVPTPSRRGRKTGRVVAALLILLVAAGLAYGLYSGFFYRAAIRGLEAENAARQASIESTAAENAAKDGQIEALTTQAADKQEQIDGLSEAVAGRDLRLAELDEITREKDEQLEALESLGREKDARLAELDGEIAEKELRIETLEQELARAQAPLDYQAALQETVPEAALQSLDQPGMENVSEEERRAALQALLQGAALAPDPDKSQDDRPAYRIVNRDGLQIGSLVFEAAEDPTVWTAAEESFDFSPCLRTMELTVPAEYQICLGDTPLGEEWIREQDIPFAALAYCAGQFEGLPTLVRYETPPLLSTDLLHIRDGKGRELSAEELSEERFLDRCPQEARERIEAYLPGFLELYVLFSADIRESAYYYYEQLKPLVLPESPLAQRMRDAFEGFGYSAARKADYQSFQVHWICDLGEGRYAVDLNYLTLVTGHSSAFEPVEDDLHVLLILKENEKGQLLAEAFYYL